MRKSDSASMWLSDSDRVLETSSLELPSRNFLGPTTFRLITTDPIYFTIYCARYKFLARLLSGTQRVAEIGFGDGFGTTYLANVSKEVVGFDIDSNMLEDCRQRLQSFENLKFLYHDFVSGEHRESLQTFDAVVMKDLIEHIYPHEQREFLANVFKLLRPDGIALIGTPNIEASRFASENSRRTHVNLKSAATLRSELFYYFEKVLIMGQNDEVVHTGFDGMCHYLWAICFGPKRQSIFSPNPGDNESE